MIIRELKEAPELLETFDWWHEYVDTVRWAKRICPELVEALDDGFKNYLEERNHGGAPCQT